MIFVRGDTVGSASEMHSNGSGELEIPWKTFSFSKKSVLSSSSQNKISKMATTVESPLETQKRGIEDIKKITDEPAADGRRSTRRSRRRTQLTPYDAAENAFQFVFHI
uniref:Uncharacterized protein n=1 Tax=Romanomermis culicivorax TaxID=13658 RepID=A0A915HFL4_ROMCU